MFNSRIALILVLTFISLPAAGCGGGASSTGNPTPTPAPTIATISPNTAVAGGAAFTLTINGTNFVPTSMVNFGGTAPATTFVNSMQLTAVIPATAIASTGALNVTVTNPGNDGGTSISAPLAFTVTSGANPVPTISVLYPSCVPAGEQFVDGVDNQLTVIGPTPGSLVAGSVVRWNGSDRPTMSNGSVNAVVAQIPATDIAEAGTATVTVFNPAPGGGTSNSLTFSITPGAVGPASIVVDPAGKFAYVIDGGCPGGVGGYISMYTIDATTGALTSLGTIDAGTNPVSVVVDPTGKFAYVTNSGSNDVSMYTIDASTGALTSTGTAAAGATPVFIAVDPSGKFAYVTNSGSNDVSMYTINTANGALTPTGTIATGSSPTSVAIHPTGKFAYVTNSGSNDVSIYSIDAASGLLTLVGTIGS